MRSMSRHRPSRQADAMDVWMLDLLTWCWSKPTMPNFGIDCHHNRINDQYMLNNVVGEYTISSIVLQSFFNRVLIVTDSNLLNLFPDTFPQTAWCANELYWPNKRQPQQKAPRNCLKWTHCSGNVSSTCSIFFIILPMILFQVHMN